MKIVIPSNQEISLSPEKRYLVLAAPGNLVSDPSETLTQAIGLDTGEVWLSDQGESNSLGSLDALFRYAPIDSDDGRRMQAIVMCAGNLDPVSIVTCQEILEIEITVPRYGTIRADSESLTPQLAKAMLDFILDSELESDEGELITQLNVDNIQHNPAAGLYHVFGSTETGAQFLVDLQYDLVDTDELFRIVDWSCK